MKEKKNNFNADNRQLELIDEFYSLDKEKKIIFADFRYEKASDLLDNNIGDIKHPQFSNDVLEDIEHVLENIPNGFKVDINFYIKDYGNYNANKLITTFNNTLELRRYNSRKNRLNKQLFSSLLILIGIIVLFLMIILKNYFKFKNQIQEDIIEEVLDITAWVFIWEAVTLLFLEIPNETKFAIEIQRKISKISFYDSNEKMITYENREEIFKNWESISRLKTIGKYMVLTSSVAFLFLAVYSVYLMFLSINKLTNPQEICLTVVLTLVISLIKIFAGISGIKLFLNKIVKHYKLLTFYALFLLVSFCVSIIVILFEKDYTNLVSAISSFAISIIFSVGFFINKPSKE